jgi:hypothetical protein
MQHAFPSNGHPITVQTLFNHGYSVYQLLVSTWASSSLVVHLKFCSGGIGPGSWVTSRDLTGKYCNRENRDSVLHPAGNLSASREIDGNINTFSHTSDGNAWLEIDMGAAYPINYVAIVNCWCLDPNDSPGCL